MEAEDFKVAGKKYQTDKSQTIRKMWEIIAKRPSDFDMQIIEALKDTILEPGTTTDSSSIVYGCYGPMIYDIIRKALMTVKKDGHSIDYLLGGAKSPDKHADKHADKHPDKHPDKQSDKNKDKKAGNTSMKKADVIRMEGTIKKLNERLSVMLNSLNPDKFTIPSESIMNSHILEIRAIGFIYMVWFIIKHKSEYIEVGDIVTPY